jgi:transposase
MTFVAVVAAVGAVHNVYIEDTIAAMPIAWGRVKKHIMHQSNGSVSTEIKPATSPKKPQRRRFSASEKLRIVRESDACPAGSIGTLLRREGIYSSQLYAWRKQRDCGELDPGALRNRAQAKNEAHALTRRVAELERENRTLRRKLTRAELISDIQKKAAGLLGIELTSPESNESAE